MGKNTSISLDDYFIDFIQTRLNTGRYRNASEVIRTALRLLEEEEHKIEVLKKALDEGVASGIAKEFDPEEHLSKLKSKELVNEIRKLPPSKIIYVIEKAIQLLSEQKEKKQMSEAAVELLDDYTNDKELTVFTNLDFEDFYETK